MLLSSGFLKNETSGFRGGSEDSASRNRLNRNTTANTEATVAHKINMVLAIVSQVNIVECAELVLTDGGVTVGSVETASSNCIGLDSSVVESIRVGVSSIVVVEAMAERAPCELLTRIPTTKAVTMLIFCANRSKCALHGGRSASTTWVQWSPPLETTNS